ncbi:MAG TPA: DUF58 domain-containing protein [Candidatus Syntrophosphaera sp.]|nr:MAG: hypothetical protein BWX83_00203 [Candidatus Cloacimonetes bacterium ADurb.Bin117]HOH47799.1 DUF58 domain-containing protein [Candidatus Syntrophosphaera sp.]HPX66425.1 DUF58 domain-containing protein [Candidatus Syntrophosphaera sp.]
MPARTPAEILSRVERIEIRARGSVSETFRGEYHSSFRGQGLEFAEVREYQSGDNYRDIDWNVSARLGIPYIKKYQETRELNVFFIVDVSASQNFGTSVALKQERVAEIIALLSLSALSNNDKVGLIMFSEQLEKYLPARKGRNKALEILRDVLYLEPKHPGTNLGEAFTFASRILKKRSVIFILSDLFDSGYQKSLRLLAQKHDVVAVQVLDEAELSLPDAGVLNLRDPETGATLYVNSSHGSVRKAYEAGVKKRQQVLAHELKSMQVDHILIRNRDSAVKALRSFFEERKRRRRTRG